MKKIFTTGTILAVLAALMILLSLSVTAAPVADLTSLNVNTGGGNLITAFSPTTYEYTIAINDDHSLYIAAGCSGGDIRFGGATNPWQKNAANLTLTPAEIDNGTRVLIDARDSEGNIRNYIVNIRINSNLADLAGTTVKIGGTVFPVEVDTDHIYYGKITVSSGDTITVDATAKENGTVTIASNDRSFTLAVGASREVKIAVTSESKKETGQFTILVTRSTAVSNNANLSGLAISGSGTWDYEFNGNGTRNDYSYILPGNSSVTSINVTPTTVDAGATVTVNGGTAVPKGSYKSVSLNSTGATTVTIIVTAPNGATRTYIITVSKGSLSNNNDLTGLTVRSSSSSGTIQTLYPSFSRDITEYNVFVVNSISSLYIAATRDDNGAKVAIIRGTSITESTSATFSSLSTGDSTIDVKVTASNGSSRTYTIHVRRATSSALKDSDLSKLVMRSGSSGSTEVSLNPSFKPGITSYTATVGDSISACRFVPTLSDSGSSGARAIVAGYATSSGNVSPSVSLARGKNTITIRVMAADCTTYTDYKVDVYRGNGDSSLSALTLRDGSANNISYTPVFKSATTTYQASVANTVTSIAIRPAVNDANATVKVNSTTLTSGNWSSNIALNEGTNNIIIEVTAPDGTKTNYTLQIVRQQKPQANQIKLTIGSNIAVVDGAQKTLDSKPLLYSYNKNSYTMVPVRFVSEQLGAKVDWADATKIVTITMGGKVLTLKINEVKPDIGLDAPAILYTDPVLKAPRTMVPLRYVSEQLGAKVDWDNNAKTVTITR